MSCQIEFRSTLDSVFPAVGRDDNRSLFFEPVDTALGNSAQLLYVDGFSLKQLMSVASRCILVYALIEYWISGDNMKAMLGSLNERTIGAQTKGNDWAVDVITHEMLSRQEKEKLLRPILSLLTHRFVFISVTLSPIPSNVFSVFGS